MRRKEGRGKSATTNTYMSTAGTGGDGARGMRSGGERRRRRTRSTADGTELPPTANDMPGLPFQLRELPLHAAAVQIFPMQPPEVRHTNQAEGSGTRGRKEGTHPSVAAGGQRTWGRKRRPQWSRGHSRQGREEWMVNGTEGKWEGQQGRGPRDDVMPERETDGKIEMKRKVGENNACAKQHEQNIWRDECALVCAIKTDRKWCAIRDKHANGTSTIQPERNSLNCSCGTVCKIRIIHGKSTLRNKENMERRKRTNKHAVEYFVTVYVWIGICGIGIKWLVIRGKGGVGTERKERLKNKEGAKANDRANKNIRQQRLIQQRIRRWNKTRIVKYYDKDRKKYRHKSRASLPWSRRNYNTEANQANLRERRNRVKMTREENMKRNGGAGGRGRARAVEASYIEEELVRDISVPQHTWGDGSCWLWAVAGALRILEGKEGPTENDIKLEKKWRIAIQDTVKAHGIPMTDDEVRGLGEGVHYTHGRLVRGGTWGGGRNTKH
eukprot:6176598-Pleurochrysis_carterae.AAC.4